MSRKKISSEDSFLSQTYIDIFEKAPIGIYILNRQGEIEMFNPCMLKMAGAKSVNQVIGLNALKMPSYRKSGLTKFFKQGLKGNSFEAEVEYTSQTGKKTTFRHYYGTPIFEPDKKKVKGLLLMVEDVTQNRLTQRRLQASEQKYRMIFDLSPEAILILDRQGRFLEMNGRVNEWLGYERHELIGKNIFRLPIFTPKGRAMVVKNFVARMAGKDIEPYELEFVTKRGETRVGIILANPIRNEKGKVVADLVMTYDITEKKRAEAMKSEFVSIVSHQLRTPLTGIKWCTELLLKDKTIKCPPRQRDFLNQIAASNQRMIRLIEELLDVSRIETGKRFTVRKKRTKMVNIIKHVIQDNISLVEQKGIRIEVKIPSDVWLRVDAEKMEHVWLNLLENALKYSKEKSKIWINCKEKSDEYIFSIKDEGIGIPDEEQAMIFQKFFRATNAADIDSNGTGLGLYILKAFVEAHKGRTWLKSKEGKGTTFFVALPK